MAIVLKDVILSYRSGKTRIKALDLVNLSSDFGAIYGLLGPSGCGKTSILSCSLGILKPSEGTVLVNGMAPHSEGLGLPGPLVGYMPQGLALHSYFTAREMLAYYGRLFNVEQLEKRIRSLLEMLDLAKNDIGHRQVTKLSGGQRRRVSLACAIIHNPKILVLDEPTVGIDPVLRQTIWQMLRDMAKQGTAIIITTHYMEEASMANKIGFLRRGRMLAEGTPRELSERHELETLDAIFYRLCEEDSLEEKSLLEDASSKGSNLSDCDAPENHEDRQPLLSAKPKESLPPLTISHGSCFQALLYKNLSVLRRHTAFMVFQTILPVITFMMFLGCIGQPLRGLSLAVYNGEKALCHLPNRTTLHCMEPSLQGLIEGELYLGEELSCHFLDQLDRFTFGELKFYPEPSEAQRAVAEGYSHGMVFFEEGFSFALAARLQSIVTSQAMDAEQIDLSQIKVSIDATNLEIARTLKSHLWRSVQGFFLLYADECSLPQLSSIISHVGVSFRDARSDSDELAKTNLSHSMLPGVMTLVLCLLSMALTADVLATEREAGLLTRDFVCGVPLFLVLLSQMLVMLAVTLCQILFSLVLLAFVFPDLSFGLISFLGVVFLFQSLCGMSLGFVITSVLKSRDQVIQAGVGFIFPAFLLSGVLWPRVAMPKVLQWLALAMPSTIPCDVTRDVVVNSSLDVNHIGLSMAIPFIWTVASFAACLFVLKRWGVAV